LGAVLIRRIPFILTLLSLIATACSPGQSEKADGVSFPGDTGGAGLPIKTVSPTVMQLPTDTPIATATEIVNRDPDPSPTETAQATPSPPACWRQGGRIERGAVRTDLLPLPLEYRLYLPPCYARLPHLRYPVLYLIHGQSFNDDQWDRLGMGETADRLIAAGAISPLIIVMPRDRVWTQPTEDPFGQAVADVLLPWIDEHYRTRPEREYRAIGGLSRGAGWALHLGLSRWESFGAVGLHSLPVFWADLPHIRTWLDAIPADSLPRIYMDSPDKDRPQIARSTAWFEGLLTELGIPHEWHLFPGYHEEAYWEAHVEEYLRWYTREWPVGDRGSLENP